MRERWEICSGVRVRGAAICPWVFPEKGAANGLSRAHRESLREIGLMLAAAPGYACRAGECYQSPRLSRRASSAARSDAVARV